MTIHKNEEGSLGVCAQVLVLHLILVTPPSSMITQQDGTDTVAQNEYGDKGPVQTHSVYGGVGGFPQLRVCSIALSGLPEREMGCDNFGSDH